MTTKPASQIREIPLAKLVPSNVRRTGRHVGIEELAGLAQRKQPQTRSREAMFQPTTTAETNDQPNSKRQDIYSRVTQKIITDLERGVRPWMRPWNAENLGARVARPLRHDGTPYRGINIVMLWAEATEKGYGAPHWMTYRQAAELGGWVRRRTWLARGLCRHGQEVRDGRERRRIRTYDSVYERLHGVQRRTDRQLAA
jgi:hypothetical protein